MSSSRHNEQLKSYLASHKNGAKKGSPAAARYSSPHRLSNSPTSKVETQRSGMAGHSSSASSHRSTLATDQSSPNAKSKAPVKSPSSAKTHHARSTMGKSYYRKPTMESIPEELLLKIFQYMSASDLLVAACVCRVWLKLTADNLIWERLFIRQTSYAKPTKDGQRLGTPLKGPPETKWKRECVHWCKEKRKQRITALMKKIHPYTFLPANTEKAIQKLSIKWQLVLTDSNKTQHAFIHSDVFCFPTTTTIRWYSLEPPPIKQLRHIAVFGLSPIFFDRNGNAEGHACSKSVLLETKLNISQHAIQACDEYVNLHVIGQGLLLATWKDGGEIAFLSLCLHNHMLVQSSCLGTVSREYVPASLKPKCDDVDTQYGLHHYSCIIELRNQRAVLWGQQFTNLHCEKDNISDGFAHLIPIRPDIVSDHSFTTKNLNLPWKTDIFKGIVQNFCILDVTIFDEFKSPMWVISKPVRVLPNEDAPLTYNYDGDPYMIEHTDDKGTVTLNLVTDTDRFVVTGITIDVALTTINSWFSTKY